MWPQATDQSYRMYQAKQDHTEVLVALHQIYFLNVNTYVPTIRCSPDLEIEISKWD